MLKIFEAREDLLIQNSSVNVGIIRLFATFLFLGIALLLSTRDIGIAKDDLNYLNYFIYADQIESDDLFLYLLEEPLWRLYTTIVTQIASPELSLKITLFISASMFLFSVNKVNERLFFLLALIFVLHQDFATQMYFNQIRQGLALALFFFISTKFKRPLFAALLAIFIHTSFIFPFLFILLSVFFKSTKTFLVFILLSIMLLYGSASFLQNFDLGRREGVYEFEQIFTPNYYIYVLLRYVPILILLYYYGEKERFGFWFKLAFSSLVIVLPFTLVYSAAGRLMYYVAAFFLVLIFQQNKTIGGKLSLIYYIAFIIFDIFLTDSAMLENWGLIL